MHIEKSPINYFHELFADPDMASLKSELFHEVAEESDRTDHNKVTIVGIGAVGMAAAFSILTQVRLN